MRLFPFFLTLLLACTPASAEEIRISLKSADGRTADFSGILAVNEAGLLVSTGPNPEPFLLRWELLDLFDLERQFPGILARRGSEHIVSRGIYAPENQMHHPRAALYRILHSPRQVAPPLFSDFFSRVPPTIPRPTGSPDKAIIHQNSRNFVNQLQDARWRYERLLERLFPRENWTIQAEPYFHERRRDPADMDSPQIHVNKEGDDTDWQLTPFLALQTLATPEMRQKERQSGPHVDQEFTRWTADYLRRENIFQSLIFELMPLLDAADPSQKPELRRLRAALEKLRPNGPVDPQAIEELRLLLDRYQLPDE